MEEELFGRRIRPHDRHQFEMKLDYLFQRKQKGYQYLIEAFFFIPTSLDLHPDNYGHSDFYKDVQNYIRFKTPTMTFEYLVDPEAKDSPLYRMNEKLGELLKKPEKKLQQKFLYEAKLLACIFRSTFRENIELILGEINRLKKLEDPHLLGQEILEMIRVFQEKYGAVLESYRKMGPRLVQSGLTKIRNSFQLIDEFLSLTVENYTYHLLEEVDRIENTGIRDQLFEKVRDIILIEENYRKSKGYLSILEPRSSKNELFLYRHGLIKKYCFKILHLEISPKNIEKTWHHLFYALAAGIAMAFATLVGFLAQKYFPNFSFSLLLAFVIIYMFKDRLKDIFRDLFQKWLNKRFYDRTIEILDPSYNKRLGQCKEKFYYTSFWDLDPKIQELRRLDTLPGLEVEDRGETIFCYKRRITLFSAPVFKLHSRISGLNDILRFNVKHMLTKMDEPFHEIPFIRPDTLRISRLQVPKIYHLNVVFRFSVEGDEETVLYERLRLVLNQKGIQRVERISPGGKIQKMIS